MSNATPVREQAAAARQLRMTLATRSGAQRDALLRRIAGRLREQADTVLAANARDLARGRAQGLSAAMLDRLQLDGPRIQALARDLEAIATLPDPLAEVYDQRTLDNGLRLHRQRVPLGVLGVVYESRPNVTLDVAALALKSGNALLLRGGREALDSNRALVGCVHQALEDCALPAGLVQFVDRPERESVAELLACHGLIDLLIPRGGAELQRLCVETSRIPVVTGGIGICHLFVDASADLERALEVIANAKLQRPTVCNALDTLLVHAGIAARLLPMLRARLLPAGVELRADARALAILGEAAAIRAAEAGDFDREWLSLVLGVAVVDDLDAAMAHIARHSSGHSDGILSATAEHIARFVREVDSAAVYVNASTRFTDGGQFGLGAEVAVSTQRLHARGPMGLRELTTYKWVAEGDYHVRA